MLCVYFRNIIIESSTNHLVSGHINGFELEKAEDAMEEEEFADRQLQEKYMYMYWRKSMPAVSISKKIFIQLASRVPRIVEESKASI